MLSLFLTSNCPFYLKKNNKLNSFLHCSRDTDPQLENHHVTWRPKGDSREGFLVIVGFYAADIMRRGRVQSLHQEVERAAELKRERHERTRTSVAGGERRAAAGPTWCPTVFLWSLLGALGVDFAERTLTLDLEATGSSFSWNRSATIWNWEEKKTIQF